MTCVHSVTWFCCENSIYCEVETCSIMQVYPQSIEQTQVPQCFFITFHYLRNCKDRLCRQVIEVAPASKIFQGHGITGTALSLYLSPLTSRSSCLSRPLQSWPQKQSTAQSYKAHFPVTQLQAFRKFTSMSRNIYRTKNISRILQLKLYDSKRKPTVHRGIW